MAADGNEQPAVTLAALLADVLVVCGACRAVSPPRSVRCSVCHASMDDVARHLQVAQDIAGAINRADTPMFLAPIPRPITGASPVLASSTAAAAALRAETAAPPATSSSSALQSLALASAPLPVSKSSSSLPAASSGVVRGGGAHAAVQASVQAAAQASSGWILAPEPSSPVPQTPDKRCPQCNEIVGVDDKFCRACGSKLTSITSAARTQVMPQFALLKKDGFPPARVVLVRGTAQVGQNWTLDIQSTILGRDDGHLQFPADLSLARRHLRMTWRNNELFVEPEETTNGVYLRVRDAVTLKPGDEFVVGAQRLQVLGKDPWPPIFSSTDGTRVLGSHVPRVPSIAVLRIAVEPRWNEVYHRAQPTLSIGRSGCDVCFPLDGFVSEKHVQLTQSGDAFLLEDLRSRNGTYVRIRLPTRVSHGDLLLLGQQVLRIEIGDG